jgi:hypothetical protein
MLLALSVFSRFPAEAWALISFPFAILLDSCGVIMVVGCRWFPFILKMFLELRFRSNMARFKSSIDDTFEISLLILYDQRYSLRF